MSAVGPFAETVAGDALAGAVAHGSVATWGALALVGAPTNFCALRTKSTRKLKLASNAVAPNERRDAGCA